MNKYFPENVDLLIFILIDFLLQRFFLLFSFLILFNNFEVDFFVLIGELFVL